MGIHLNRLHVRPPIHQAENDCVFLVVDYFSKMAILVACKKNIKTEATAKLFFERVWVHFGIPQTIVSDQDCQFLITFWSSLWSLLDTRQPHMILIFKQEIAFSVAAFTSIL
jgi:hypothetical protein